MAHYGIVAPPLRGHMDPMRALAAALRVRGHRVSVLLEPQAAHLLDAADALIPLHLPASVLHPDRKLGGVAGLRGAFQAVHMMARRTDALCDALPDALRGSGVDGLLVDQTEPAGVLAALRLGLPYASVACALPLDRRTGTPPAFVDWPYDPSPRGLARNRGGHRIVDLMMMPLSRIMERRAAQWGISGIKRWSDGFSSRLQILQLTPSLEFPCIGLPEAIQHVGPLRNAETEAFDLPEGRGTLAFCSLGTLQGGRVQLLRFFAEAVREVGLTPVIAHGGRLSPQEEASLPPGSIVHAFLPQRAVLAHCALAVVHGGLNTVLDAMAAGVPAVATPIAFEQGAIAARLARSGAGLVVAPRRAERDLPRAVSRILAEPSFRREAGRLRQEIANAGGAERAAQLVERRLAVQARPGSTIAGPAGRAAGHSSGFSSGIT